MKPYFLIIFLFIYSCKQKEVSLNVLKPTISLKAEDVNSLGLKKTPTDALVYKTKINDTIIIFNLSNENVISQEWIVKFKKLDSLKLNDFLSKNHTIKIGNITKNQFILHNYNRNTIFIGEVFRKNENSFLSIKYMFPYKHYSSQLLNE